ncbi:MAG: hypothetical protein HKO53_00560 [Gemmatimonadetes bacterium]|nr:hypothetical protein [Gemmatimonadota bacterium]
MDPVQEGPFVKTPRDLEIAAIHGSVELDDIALQGVQRDPYLLVAPRDDDTCAEDFLRKESALLSEARAFSASDSGQNSATSFSLRTNLPVAFRAR